MSLERLKVGDEVHEQGQKRRDGVWPEPKVWTVDKVGRRWLNVSHGKWATARVDRHKGQFEEYENAFANKLGRYAFASEEDRQRFVDQSDRRVELLAEMSDTFNLHQWRRWPMWAIEELAELVEKVSGEDQ